jgi:ABC-type amino acid transport substrate-binding protein
MIEMASIGRCIFLFKEVKQMKRHWLSVVVLPVAVLLSSCGGIDTLGDNVLTVGLECEYAPFNWTTTVATETSVAIQDQPGLFCDGYDVRVAQYLADELDVELEVRKLAWDGLIPALNAGTIAAIIAGMTDTTERRESITFTNPYFETTSVMVVLNDSDFVSATTIEDFEGATVVAQLGTIQNSALADYADEESDNYVGLIQGTAYETYFAAFQALVAGDARVDAILAEAPFAAQMQTAYPNQLTVIELVTEDGEPDDNFLVTVSVGLRLADSSIEEDMNDILATISDSTRQTWMNEASVASNNL